jgi:pimeloyl-ACP methyl ester carboxylesterase
VFDHELEEQQQAPSVDNLPLVMIHGFGCGIPQFYKNFDHLHSNRKLYAIDLPGFARSTRVNFTPDAKICEQEFVDYIEKWREGVGLEKFILLGHSLGAFLSCCYTMRHPSRVRHLILDDPWGFPQKPAQIEVVGKRRLVYKAATLYTKRFNPLSPIRFAGPLGMP